MSNLDIKPKWNTSINQIEPDEYIIGGPSGSINTAPRQLAENIFWLKGSVDTLQSTASSALSTANKASTDAQRAEAVAQNAESVASTIDDKVEKGRGYRLEEDRKILEYNDLPATDGSFPTSLADELRQNYEATQGIYQRAKNIGECRINFTNELTGNFTALCVPFLTIEGVGRRRVLPVTFNANLMNTAVTLPLFKPTRTNGNGFLTFKYIGKKPLHVTLTGSATLLYKDASISTDGYVDIIPWLIPINPPKSEVGQNAGKRALGYCGGSQYESKPLVDYESYNDNSFPINDEIMEYVNSPSFKNLYVGSEAGYISKEINPREEKLVVEEDSGTDTGNIKTTKWMDVLGIDNTSRIYVMLLGGVRKSSRSRVQIKDVYGNIAYCNSISGNFSSERLYRLPPEAAQVRIYYSAANDNVNDEDIKFGALTTSLSYENDPILGMWSSRSMTIHKDVVFYPDTEYLIEMFCMLSKRIDNTLNSLVREWGFRFQSGGISFLFDATDMVNELADRAWRK